MDNLLQTTSFPASRAPYPPPNAVYAQAYPIARYPRQALEGEPETPPAEQPAPAAEAPPAESPPAEQPAAPAAPPAEPPVPPPQPQPQAEPYHPPQPPQYAPSYPQQYPGQYPPQQQYPQPPQYGAQPGYAPYGPGGQQYAAAAPAGESCAQPCSNPACDKGPLPGGCLRAAPGPPGWACDCPAAAAASKPAQPVRPPVGSEEWKQLSNNRYGEPLAINETDAAEGMQVATYESGHVAYQLARYLRHKAKEARVQAEIEEVILKDLSSAQPCRLVAGGPGGYRCATSDSDQGDSAEGSGSGSGSGSGDGSGSGEGSGSGAGGIFGLGFLGL